MPGSEYCRDKAAPAGSSLYYACLFHGEHTQRGLYALFALYHELLDSFLAASDPGVARIRQEWWREELARLQDGRPRHPVAAELQAMAGLESGTLRQLPDAVESLFPVSDSGDLEAWLNQPGIAAFWQTAAGLAGGGGDAAAETGVLLVRLEQLQHLPALLHLGVNPLPGALLAAHGLDRDALLGNPAGAATSAVFADIIASLASRLDTAWRRGKSERSPLFVLVMNRLGATLCREIRRDGHAILQRRVALTPIRKLWIASRTRYSYLLSRALIRNES